MAERLMRRSGPVAVVVAVLVAFALLVGASASSSSAATTPVVKPGAAVTLSASGFRAHTRIVLAIQNTTARRYLTSDGHGRVSIRLRVRTKPGTYRYLFVGAPPTYGRPGAPPTRGRGDHQVVEVAVPRLVTVLIIVRKPPGHGGKGTGGQGTGKGHKPGGGDGTGGQGAHDGGPGTSSGSGTANTGLDILAGVAAGALALVAGAVLVLFGRRRGRGIA